MSDPKIPSFDDLPVDKAGPKLNAWGLYGPTDQLGALNRLTPALTVTASTEIRTGHRIGLDWPLDAQGALPFFNRAHFRARLIDKAPRAVNDDEWSFNTQCSSQWDGLRHFAYQRDARFYNGVSQPDVHGDSTVNGIGAWSAQGIVGRGVLLDWHAWRLARGVRVGRHDAFRTAAIPLADLTAVLDAQGVTPRLGDILFVRSGWMDAYARMSAAEIGALRDVSPPGFVGVEQSEAALRWVWEHFAAVAGDQPSWECWPTQEQWSFHEVLLSGWGMPIGELFDLEALSKHCAETKRYTFFCSSVPCNVPGGVASPPNAVAIF